MPRYKVLCVVLLSGVTFGVGCGGTAQSLSSDAEQTQQDGAVSQTPVVDAGAKRDSSVSDAAAGLACRDEQQARAFDFKFLGPKAGQNRCTSQQISEVTTSVALVGAEKTLEKFGSTHADCILCLTGDRKTPAPAPAAYEIGDDAWTYNHVGCAYAAIGKPECAEAAMKRDMCAWSQCKACTVTGELSACYDEAETSAACISYAPSKECADAYGAGKKTIDASCNGADYTAQSYFLKVANYLCGAK